MARLGSEKEFFGFKIKAFYFLTLVMAWVYQMNEYYTFFNYDNDIRDNIHSIELTLDTINSLQLAKLYALETYIDNSTFLNYPPPGASFNSLTDQLYIKYRQLYDLLPSKY